MNDAEIIPTVKSTQWMGESGPLSGNIANRIALLKPFMDLYWISFGFNPAYQKNKLIYYMPCVHEYLVTQICIQIAPCAAARLGIL